MKKKDLIKQLNIELSALPVPDVLDKVRQKSDIVVAQKVFKLNEAKPKRKRGIKLVPAFMAFVLLFAVVATNFISPLSSSTYTTVTVDINPSFEVTYDENDIVVEVNAINNDAINLLQDLALVGQKFIDSVDEIFDKAVEQGFLNSSAASNYDNAVMISIRNENSIKKQQEKFKLEQRINSYFNNESIPFNYIYEEIEEAQEDYKRLEEELKLLEEQFQDENLHMSEAKYKYIKQIITRFPELAGKEEKLARMNMTELYKLLQGHEANIPSGEDLINDILDGHIDGWEPTAEHPPTGNDGTTNEGPGSYNNDSTIDSDWLRELLKNLFGKIGFVY